MRILFAVFTVFLLLIPELLLGTCGIYFPLAWMGFFYFNNAPYPGKFIKILGFSGALLVDSVLFHRVYLPDVLIFLFILFFSVRYREFWRGSVWHCGFFAFLLLPLSYGLQFISDGAANGFTWEQFAASAAQMTVLAPFGFMILVLLTAMLDMMQKKFKMNSAFVLANDDIKNAVYRKNTGVRGNDR